MASELDQHPLAGVVEHWLTLFDGAAKDQKKERWGKYADEIYKFYNTAHNFMWDDEYAQSKDGYLTGGRTIPLPEFKMTLNRISDGVDLFAPSMLNQYPEVEVSPVYLPQVNPVALGIDLQDPNAAQQYQIRQYQKEQRRAVKEAMASTKQHYLNWLQLEAGKKAQAQRAITEAIVTGLGLLYTRMYSPRGSNIRYPRSEYVPTTQYLKDPDATRPEDVQCIAIEWTEPVNLVEARFKLPPGSLLKKGHLQSREAQASDQGRIDAQQNDRENGSWDLITYKEIYSKNGLGSRLKAAHNIPDPVRKLCERFGDFCYIVVAKGVPYPLNLPDSVWEKESKDDVFMRAQWPIPFWRDDASANDWPVSELFFKEDPRSVWPISPFKPAIGLIRFVNWAFSFLADKIARSAIDWIAFPKALEKDIRAAAAGSKGPFRFLPVDLTMMDAAKSIDSLVKILDKPTFDTGLWTIVKEAIFEIEKSTGLNDVLYAMGAHQMRSATEAEIMGGNATIRIDEMANKTDDFYTLAATKEMQAAAWELDGDEVALVFDNDPELIHFWDTGVRGQDFVAIIRDYSYRLANNSSRKPNKHQRLRALTDISQYVLPVYQQYALQGVVGPWNAFMQDMAEAVDIQNVERYLLPEPEPQEGPSPEEIQAQLEAQAKQQDMQMKVQEHEMKLEQMKFELEKKMTELQVQLQTKQAETAITIQGKQAEQAVGIQGKQADQQMKVQDSVLDMHLKAAQAAQGMQFDQASHVQEMRQDEEVHDQDMDQAREEGAVKRAMMRQQKPSQGQK